MPALPLIPIAIAAAGAGAFAGAQLDDEIERLGTPASIFSERRDARLKPTDPSPKSFIDAIKEVVTPQINLTTVLLVGATIYVMTKFR